MPPICLGQLPSNPFGARMRGYTQPQKLASTVLQDQESVQQPKRNRRDQEQIHRCDAVGMIAKEGLPALRRRHSPPHHVLCDRGSDVNSELEQFAVYPRGAPKRICDAHLANEMANVRRCRWPATARSGFPAPKGSEAGTVPAYQRLWSHNFQSVQHFSSQAIEPNKHQPVDVAERHSLRGFAPQHVELMPKYKETHNSVSCQPSTSTCPCFEPETKEP